MAPEGAVVGVLVMAYGTPATPEDIEAYYTHVRRGRPPTVEQLAELRGRYVAIGGTSPLLEQTRAQVAGLQAALGDGYRVELGMKHAPPFLEDGVRALLDAGVERIVGLVLAPHYSRLSVGEYAARLVAATAAAAAGVEVRMVESWHLEPGYLDLLARFVHEAGASRSSAEVVFTAHSLPARILNEGDPYPRQLHETATAVAERAGVARWSVGWQSAGRTPEPWIGPDILAVLRARAAAGAPRVVVCPAGFVSDHLEVLYDLDVEASALARDLGLGFARTRMPNDDPEFCAALADVVRRRA
jgi:ferrochelatase